MAIVAVHSDCVRHAFHRDAVDSCVDARRYKHAPIERAGWFVTMIRAGTLCIGCFLLRCLQVLRWWVHHRRMPISRYVIRASLHRRRHSGGGEFVGGSASSPIGAVTGAFHTDACRIVPLLHAHFTGLADRSARRHSHRGAGPAPLPQPPLKRGRKSNERSRPAYQLTDMVVHRDRRRVDHHHPTGVAARTGFPRRSPLHPSR